MKGWMGYLGAKLGRVTGKGIMTLNSFNTLFYTLAFIVPGFILRPI